MNPVDSARVRRVLTILGLAIAASLVAMILVHRANRAVACRDANPAWVAACEEQ